PGADSGTFTLHALCGDTPPYGESRKLYGLLPRLAHRRPRPLGALDLFENLSLDRLEMLARRRAPREGLGDRTPVSIEQRQLERHPERALGVEGAPGVFAYPIAAPGIGRGDVKLRPAPGDFTLQAELRQVVFTQRAR